MPLEDLEVIDIVLRPNENGKVGLVIMDAGVTTNPARRAALFREKVRSYFGAVVEGHFKAEHPKLKTSDFYIKAVCTTAPTPEMYELHSLKSKSRPEHHMEVVFEMFDGRLWPGQKFEMAKKPEEIPPPSAALKKFAEESLALAFDTLRDNCFHAIAISLEKGEKSIACLALPSEQIILCAQDMAAKASRHVSHFVCIYDAFITEPGQGQHDALMARCSERGRERGLLMALKYTPRAGRKKAAAVGEPYIVGECENDLEPGK